MTTGHYIVFGFIALYALVSLLFGLAVRKSDRDFEKHKLKVINKRIKL